MGKLVFAIVAIISICSCVSSAGNRGSGLGGIALDSIKKDSVYALSSNENAPKCTVSVNLIYVEGNNSRKINNIILRSGVFIPEYLPLGSEQIGVKQAVDSFVKRYVNGYRNDYKVMYSADKEHSASYSRSYELSTEARAGAENTLVYIASISAYDGGAHGNYQTLVKNFNTQTGQLITLKDVFVAGYEQTLKDEIVEKLCDKFNVKDLDELKKEGIFIDGNVYVPENFILNKNEITFIYCEDEIAPHAVGEIRVMINRDEISKIFN